MAHFYFHIYDGKDVAHDDVGHDLINLEAAKGEALSALCAIVAEEVRSTRRGARYSIHVDGEHGPVLSAVMRLDLDDVPKPAPSRNRSS